MEQWNTKLNTQHPVNSTDKLPEKWEIFHSRSTYGSFIVIGVIILGLVGYRFYQTPKVDFLALAFMAFIVYWLRNFVKSYLDKRPQISIDSSSITVKDKKDPLLWDVITGTMIVQSVEKKVSRHYLEIETREIKGGQDVVLKHHLDLNHLDKSVGEIEHYIELYKLKHKQK
jgi:hypothetical protein